MYPEVGNRRYKAPLWVKVKGEWYFVELYNDSAKEKAFDKKWIEIGNYNVKGFLISSCDFKMAELKRMWEKLDIVGLANKLNDYFYDAPFNIIIDESRCDHSVVFGTEKTAGIVPISWWNWNQAAMPFWKGQNLRQAVSTWYFCMRKMRQKNRQNTLRNSTGMQACFSYTNHGIRWKKTGKYASGETTDCINGL